jgi:type VI secretion system protein ImpL
MAARWLRSRFGSWSAGLLTVAWLLLAAWAVGIAVAAIQLDVWRQELTRTLLQLNADAQFRARASSRDAVDPEWYRRKALALLSATQRIQHDTTWTLFVPGSWRTFDRLEEQVQERLVAEFADIVVETMRRELYARASRLTGVPLVRGHGELQAGTDCQSPVPQNLERKLSAAPQDLPEFVAVADYVAAVERLDQAFHSFQALQHSEGSPEHLRRLVAYTLDKDLPGALAGAVRMFQAGEEVSLQPALMQSKMQWAARCALGKAMGALHTRLLNTNDLLALEQGLVERSQGLFDPSARPVAFDRTLERYRTVHGLLEDQHALLAKGHNDWMGRATLQLGPAYQQVIDRIARARLLGPEAVQQLRDQSGAAFAEFRRQFTQAFGSRGEPGIVWIENERRFGLSSERAALREGLGALLKTSFMGEEALARGRTSPDGGSLAKVTQEARRLAEERERAVAEIVPRFPDDAQAVVRRVIDGRVSELIYHQAFRALKGALPQDVRTPLDPAAFRQQREQVLVLHELLKQAGGTALGNRLVATLDGELLRRFALLDEDWSRQPLQDARLDDFSWWQGEPLPLASVLGTEAAAAPALARTARRLEALVQQARALAALGSPALAHNPTANRWLQLQAELDRYHARAADSSLLRLERYVAGLGPDFRRESCAERLAAHPPVISNPDAIAERHLRLHRALLQRCQDLRALPGLPPPSAPALAPVPVPVPVPAARLAQ